MTCMHLYVIGSTDRQARLPVKIGISVQPDERCRHIQACSPVRVCILCSWKISDPAGRVDARMIESACHVNFHKYNTHGEWFNVSSAEVKRFVEGWVRRECGSAESILEFKGRQFVKQIGRAYSRKVAMPSPRPMSADVVVEPLEQTVAPRGRAVKSHGMREEVSRADTLARLIERVRSNPDAPINRAA